MIINKPLKEFTLEELNSLAKRIREYIIQVVKENGGHLASNLGVVELTIALHYVFDLEKDIILFDVGHQCYTHKILTGREKEFKNLRKLFGLSGFPKRSESKYDIFCTGHSGDAIACGLGLSLYKKETEKVVVVIGDGSLQSGVAFEGLNHCGFLKADMIVVLNDNQLAISKTKGALSNYLNRLITNKRYEVLKAQLQSFLKLLPEKIRKEGEDYLKTIEKSLKRLFLPTTFFEELGFRYFGPIDGHSIPQLVKIFKRIKQLKGPILVHVLTKKGKGYKEAEIDPETYHGVTVSHSEKGQLSYQEFVGELLCELGEKRKDIVVITPGMRFGSNLKKFSERFKERFYDCGICEQEAINFACGLALRNLKPIVVIYATFLLRAYDQLINGALLHNLPILFLIDRAGCVPDDGETHQGIYDVSTLRHLPNVNFFAPYFFEDLKAMIDYFLENNLCLFIRYPKDKGEFKNNTGKIEPEIIEEGKDGIIIGIGYGVKIAKEVNNYLKEKGISLTVVDGKIITPLKKAFYENLFQKDLPVFTIEDNLISGGFGEGLKSHFPFLKIKNFGFESQFLPTGKREELFHLANLSKERLALKIYEEIKG